MSLNAPGKVTATSVTNFTATFDLPGSTVQVNFLGKFRFLVHTFSCSNAVLKYDNDSQLSDTRQFSGQLGVNNLKFTLDNGAIMEGVLDMPVAPPSSVAGSGEWETK